MNDRCLFRAKRIDNGEWVEGYYTYYPSGFTSEDKIEHVIRDTITSVYCSNLYFVDPSTICQCTGLEDKNGKTIWENDILRYSYDYPDSPWLAAKGLTNDDIRYSIGAVFWQKWRGCWAVCGKGKSRMTNQDVFTYCRNPNRTEVIGNIFDNKELLEQEG